MASRVEEQQSASVSRPKMVQSLVGRVFVAIIALQVINLVEANPVIVLLQVTVAFTMVRMEQLMELVLENVE